MYSALSTINTTTEVPLSKASNPQLLPGHRSMNGCPLLRVCVHGVCVFTAVCVHFGWVNAEHKFRVWVTILGRMSFTFMHLADAFIQSDLQCIIHGYTFFISMCVPWELNPQPLRC